MASASTSTATKPVDTMTSAPVFSYAQAARGQAATPSQPDNSAPPSNSSLGKDDNVSTTNTIATSATSSNASDVQEIHKAMQESTDFSHLKNMDSELSSVGGSVGPDSRDDAASNADSHTHPTHKGAASSAAASLAGEASDSRKSRKGKKSRAQDKENEDESDKNKENLKVVEQPKIELSEAPIPVVNIWQQRKEERAAATKPVVPVTAKPAPSADGFKTVDVKKQPSPDEAEAASKTGAAGSRTQKKPLEVSRGSAATPNENLARRPAPRGSRLPAKDARASGDVPPSVQDPTSWPSIELAAADESKTKVEKPTQPEKHEEGGAPKPQAKKEWTHFPITPTFTYETQFGPKTTRPRGGARGGREGGSTRGGHSATGGSSDEKEATTSTGAPTKTSNESRERPRDTTGFHSRQGSQAPAVPKRGGVESSTREPRKASGAVAPENNKSERTYPSKGDGQARGPRSELTNGDHAPADRRKQSGDRREARAHDGAENGNHPVRGEGRSERGRGGFRGRGGGAGHNGASHHQQSNYGQNGQRYMGAGNGINTQNFSPTPNQYQFHNRRGGPLRAQTGPSHNGQRPNGGPPPARMPSMPMPASNQEFPVQYPPLYPTSQYGDEVILHGLRQQIEYYFSTDNLVRDIYLRARMDSQGYVLLTTIANFSRVSSLSPRHDFVQAACAQSHEIDYVTGDDGIERVRSRRDMTPFILNIRDRAEEGSSDGPNNVIFHNLDRQPPAYGNGFPPHMYTASPTAFHGDFQHGMEQYPMYPANGAHYGHGPAMNGHFANGHRFNGESQLSAAVPDFSPVSHKRPSLEEFQQFEDVEIPKLTVVLGEKKSHVVTVNGEAKPDEGTTAETLTNGAVKTSSEDAKKEDAKYPDFHGQALEQRKKTAAGETCPDMHNLYKFWVDLLTNTFNCQLYSEFRQLALDDGAQKPPSQAGLRYLLGFYEAVSNSRRPYPEEFDAHYQEARKIADAFANVTNGDTHA